MVSITYFQMIQQKCACVCVRENVDTESKIKQIWNLLLKHMIKQKKKDIFKLGILVFLEHIILL